MPHNYCPIELQESNLKSSKIQCKKKKKKKSKSKENLNLDIEVNIAFLKKNKN